MNRGLNHGFFPAAAAAAALHLNRRFSRHNLLTRAPAEEQQQGRRAAEIRAASYGRALRRGGGVFEIRDCLAQPFALSSGRERAEEIPRVEGK